MWTEDLTILANSSAQLEDPITSQSLSSFSFFTEVIPNLDSSEDSIFPLGQTIRLPYLSFHVYIFKYCTYSTCIFSWERQTFSFQATPVFLGLGSSLQGVICLLWSFLYYIFPLSDFITLTPDPAFLLVYPTCTSNFKSFKWLLILLSNKLCHLLCPILETGITSRLILAWKSFDSSVILIFHIHLVTDSTWFGLLLWLSW